MTCVDIIFPLNLGPLTYRCPGHLAAHAVPGMLVSAPLKKSLATGLIYRINHKPPKEELKDIAAIQGDTPVLGSPLLSLIAWMSEYYMANEGLILKQTFPNELFKKTRLRKAKQDATSDESEIPLLPDKENAGLRDFVSGRGYRTALLHSESIMHEYAAARALIQMKRNIIVIFPEISGAEFFFRALKQFCPDRCCILHGGMSSGRRSETMEKIASGVYDIVTGARAALFCTMERPELIIVVSEQSASYRTEEGLRFSLRDTAVMRGYLEKIPVLLTSSAPSIDSWLNVRSGKYTLIPAGHKQKSPSIRIADLRFGKKVKPYLTAEAVEKIGRVLKKNGKALVVINRRGHSTLLQCEECGSTESCPECAVPFVHHKDRNRLQCHYCAASRPVPDNCSRCGSTALKQAGAGTQKIVEDLREMFGVEPVRFDSDSASGKTEMRNLINHIVESEKCLVVGTKMITGKLDPTGIFGLAALLNADAGLNIPDFRAREKTFQDIMALRDLVSKDGEIIIQTRFPGDSLFRQIRDDNYAAFAKEESALRSALKFPPYAKLTGISFRGSPAVAEVISSIITKTSKEIEILGPAERRTKNGTEYSFLIKHAERKTLNRASMAVLRHYAGSKEHRIRIDPDPC